MSEFTDNPFFAGMEEIRKSWGWFLALGILFVLLGVACIAFDVTATYTSVLVFGWILLIGGLFALVQAFTIGNWSGFFFYLFGALLRGFTGYLLVRYPVSGAEGLTLVLASFFVVGGVFRTVASAMAKFPQWGWAVFSGIVSVALGIMLLTQWPVASVWFIGFAIGVDLIFDGAALTAFAGAIHSLPHEGMTFRHA
jgi:uncharacterized membrane protein HdeD (DUF308 family)